MLNFLTFSTFRDFELIDTGFLNCLGKHKSGGHMTIAHQSQLQLSGNFAPDLFLYFVWS